MAFEMHRRDFGTAKECRQTCADCVRRRVAKSEAEGDALMARPLPVSPLEVLTVVEPRWAGAEEQGVMLGGGR